MSDPLSEAWRQDSTKKIYMVLNKNNAIALDATHVGASYATIYTAGADEYITNLWINAEIQNPALSQFDPPSPDGVQYDADRQTQLRAYASELTQYRVGLYFRKPGGEVFRRKIVPLYKYYPDHQVDLFPLLWSITEGALETGTEILAKFETATLPVAEDSITIFIDYYDDSEVNLNESWFTVFLSANQERVVVLPDNTVGYSFKQQDGTEPLKWSYYPGVVAAVDNYDLLDPSFEEVSSTVTSNTLYFTCTVDADILVKAWSE